MTARRVVITGLGMISPIGNNKKDFWTSLIEGLGGIGHIDRFDASDFTTRIGPR